jgi:hypothetical protein
MSSLGDAERETPKRCFRMGVAVSVGRLGRGEIRWAE